MNSLNRTFLPNSNYEYRDWFFIDCRGKNLGRLSTTIVKLLKGKIKAHYYPSKNIGDYVILTNADSIIIDKTKNYHIVKNPGRPGYSLKVVNISDLLPKATIEKTIKGMLSISERKQLMRRLKVYSAKYKKELF